MNKSTTLSSSSQFPHLNKSFSLSIMTVPKKPSSILRKASSKIISSIRKLDFDNFQPSSSSVSNPQYSNYSFSSDKTSSKQNDALYTKMYQEKLLIQPKLTTKPFKIALYKNKRQNCIFYKAARQTNSSFHLNKTVSLKQKVLNKSLSIKNKSNESMIIMLNHIPKLIPKHVELERKTYETNLKKEMNYLYSSIVIKKAQKKRYKQLVTDSFMILNKNNAQYTLCIEVLNERLKELNEYYSNILNNNNSPISHNNSNIKIDFPQSTHLLRKSSSKNISIDKTVTFHKYTNIISNIENEIKEYDSKWNKIKSELTPFIETNNNLIRTITNELSSLKNRLYSNLLEQKNYYRSLLKEGSDPRQNGISWIVRRLIEINVDITSNLFPHFLDEEHISILIELAYLEYNKDLLLSILKVYKSRQLKRLNIEEYKQQQLNMIQMSYDQLNEVTRRFRTNKFISDENMKKFEMIYAKYVIFMKDIIENVIEEELIRSNVCAHKKYFNSFASQEEEKNKKDYLVCYDLGLKFKGNNKNEKEYLEEIAKVKESIENIKKKINGIFKKYAIEFRNKWLTMDKKDNFLTYQFHEQIYTILFGSKLHF